MHINVTFRHMDSSVALRKYAEEKSQRFEKYLVEPVEIHWVLSVEKIRHIAEATIVAKDLTIKAHEETQEMYSAIDMAIDKIEKQVRKHKEKIKNHKFTKPGEVSAELVVEEEEPETSLPSVVKTDNVFAKPMSVEEATLQMGVVDSKFLVFIDASTNHVNVIYRRDDGDYGLIETRTR